MIRRYSFWLWIALPVWCLAFLCLFPPHGFDSAVSRLFFDNGVFPWRTNVIFERVFHQEARVIPAAVAAFAFCTWIFSRICKNGEPLIRKDFGLRMLYAFVAFLASLAVVWWLKQTTGVSCPWAVDAFGGSHPIVDPSWSYIFRAGSCWPSAHAGTGFALLSFYFAMRDEAPKTARWILGFVLVFGTICGSIRVMQGANFFSHNIATLLIDWIVCSVLYILFFDRKGLLKTAQRMKNAVCVLMGQIFSTPLSRAHSLRLSLPTASVLTVIFFTALYWVLAFNSPFFAKIVSGAASDPAVDAKALWGTFRLVFTSATGFFFIAIALLKLLSLLPEKIFKTLLLVLSLVGATSLTASLLYGITMTPDMIRNFLATDTSEATNYLSLSTATTFLLTFAPGALLALSLKKECQEASRIGRARRPKLKTSLMNSGEILGTLAIGLVVIGADFQGFSAAMRQNKSLRYEIAPFNILYSTASTILKDDSPDAVVGKTIVDPSPDRMIGGSQRNAAVVTAVPMPQKPMIFVVVIGETTRSANWGLAGYEKPTTPRLSAMADIISVPVVEACGTSTDVSLPCMMSRIGRRDYDRKRILSEESLPLLLERAGFRVKWIDNQSGCKGVCAGIPYEKIDKANNPTLCTGGECLDGVLVEALRREIADAKNQKPGDATVLFLHMIGAHGPAYWLRSRDEDKIFGEVCTDASFRSCTPQSIAAAYNASVRYTDAVLADMLEMLQTEKDLDAGFLYVSDHGESLGEGGLFLHGAPWYIAPSEQKEVPMVMWLSDDYAADYRIDKAALASNALSGGKVMHDHLYHTILGLLKVKSTTYEEAYDLTKSKAG